MSESRGEKSIDQDAEKKETRKGKLQHLRETVSSKLREVQKLPWEGGPRRMGSQLAGVESGQGMPRVLPRSPPHHECNKRSDFPGNGAFKQCSEGLGETRIDVTMGKGEDFQAEKTA